MIGSSIKAVIFDFGGVLINIDYDATIRAFKALGIEDFDQMYSQAMQSNLFDDIETGQITPQEFIDGILHYLPEGTTRKQVVSAWNAMILDVPHISIELLHKVKAQGYQIFMLSNTNAIHIDHAYEAWDLVSNDRPQVIFDHVYLSHEIHLRKPNVEIFKYVIEDQQLNTSETLFIDDSIQHIEGAMKCGLQTYHLKGIEELQALFS
ncbi:MAG: HAD family phosphatase [Crocinitomicaceae bacterium]|nr:HAD family phosphatase [Crocinitomicaceae bacterium]